jgi:hypothetical protein
MIALASVGTLLLPVVGLAVFAFAALRWGVDSRDGSSDPRGPDQPVGLS